MMHPKPPLHAPNQKRLPGWRSMTIAAGFRFSDGLLICADLEITHGSEFKARATKIFPYSFKASGNNAVFTFSGEVMLSRQCIRKIARALASASPKEKSLSAMEDTLAEEVYEFHQKYIFKHPHYQYGTGPI